MRLYYEIFLRSFRRAATYRSAFVAGILTNSFFGMLFSSVYLALYEEGMVMNGLSQQDALTYAWAVQALLSIGAGWTILPELGQSIRSGNVISDLSRPWSFYGYWMARSFGERFCHLFWRGSITYLIGILYFGARLPALSVWPVFLLALLFAMMISFAFSFCVQLTTFWLLDNSGVIILANVLQSFFSGFLVPLAFFPPLLALIAAWLPFQAITSLPVQIWLGNLDPAAIGAALAIQIAWALALSGLGFGLLRLAMRRVIIQGG